MPPSKVGRLVATPAVVDKFALDDMIIVRHPATVVKLITLVLDLTDARTAVFADIVGELDQLKYVLLWKQQSQRTTSYASQLEQLT